MNRVRNAVCASALALVWLGASPLAAGQAVESLNRTPPVQSETARPFIQRRLPRTPAGDASPFVRTELFFGTAKPDGVVSDEEFRAFVDREVTPRFPDGLTILAGDGQFRGADDIIVKERSFVIVLLYPYETFAASARKIDRIRQLYTTAFDQQSVLRVDDPFIVWASF